MLSEEVKTIVHHWVIDKRDIRTAADQLARYYVETRAVHGLPTEDQVQLRQLLSRHLRIFLPSSPVELILTDQYDHSTPHVTTRARARILNHQTIHALEGALIGTDEAMVQSQSRLGGISSVVESSRFGGPYFLVGLARFVNHDCMANARLQPRSRRYLDVVATRDINAGEEVTVYYGSNSFGPGNIGCLCKSCEMAARGG